jgi:hypothetical protein
VLALTKGTNHIDDNIRWNSLRWVEVFDQGRDTSLIEVGSECDQTNHPFQVVVSQAVLISMLTYLIDQWSDQGASLPARDLRRCTIISARFLDAQQSTNRFRGPPEYRGDLAARLSASARFLHDDEERMTVPSSRSPSILLDDVSL